MSDYDAAFFDYVDLTARTAAERILPPLYEALTPGSILDVGCGHGAWLAVWKRLAVPAVFGIDGDYIDRSRLLIPEACFEPCNLAEGFNLQRKFDVVQCLEVAEHLPAASTALLLDSLVRHGPVVLFSAAPPGQGGHDHVNERSYEYWRQEFARRRYVALDCVRPACRTDTAIASWYRYNTMLYVHQDRLPTLSHTLRASVIPESHPVPDFAPWSYRLRKQVVRRLPVPLMTVIARVKERVIGRGPTFTKFKRKA